MAGSVNRAKSGNDARLVNESNLRTPRAARREKTL
jgi:hypothetical protein